MDTLLAILPFLLHVSAQASGTGLTTRYWDCCKPSCSWPGKAALALGSNPVATCSSSDSPLSDANTESACDSGGLAYMCTNESPWAVSDSLSYGYAAVNIAGGTEASWCCACYELTFTSGPVSGKKMIVQATNTGGDLGSNQFDIAMPGGGFGIFNGCTQQWGTPFTGWGAQYGGVSSRSMCDAFPAPLKAGCYWRFDWFQGADNPGVTFKQVTCPAALTSKTGCVRADDNISEKPTGPVVVPTYTGGAGAGTAVSSGDSGVATSSAASPADISVAPVIAALSPSSSPVSLVTDTYVPVDSASLSSILDLAFTLAESPTAATAAMSSPEYSTIRSSSTTTNTETITEQAPVMSSDSLTTTTSLTTTLTETVTLPKPQVLTVTVNAMGKHCEL